jgi:hypothetical protein
VAPEFDDGGAPKKSEISTASAAAMSKYLLSTVLTR